jgi:hypothetical protein
MIPAGFRLHQIAARQVDETRPVVQLYGAFAKVQKIVPEFRANDKFRTPNSELVGDEVRGERTPLACDFRRPAGNLVQAIFA